MYEDVQENPFTLTFGKEPPSLIEREPDVSIILNNLKKKNPGWQTCLITGVRGSGKTCLMTEVANRLSNEQEWVIVNLSPEFDMVELWAEELARKPSLQNIFKEASVDLSLFGVTVHVAGEKSSSSAPSRLRDLLDPLMNHGKRILVTVDEVVPNKTMKQLASLIQILIREKYPIYILMTGLFENIEPLKQDRSLTFLHRAWKVDLKSLDLRSIARNYQEIFHLDKQEAVEMAKETSGYAFAYQLLGFLSFESQKKFSEILTEYDDKLAQFVYEKLWDDSSENDRIVLKGIAVSGPKVEDIRAYVGMESNKFGQYRRRLLQRGIISSRRFGEVEFALPRFPVFIEEEEAFFSE